MKNERYFIESIEILKYFYRNDITAMSQILLAEKDRDYLTVMEYMICVENYIKNLREKI